jgi:hypothetical protein
MHLAADGRALLVSGLGPAKRIDLPEPIAAAWPSEKARVWQGPPPWQSSWMSSRVSLCANAFGRTVADPESGLVIRLEDDPNPPIAYRVPAEGEHSEIEIQAFASAEGVLVAHGGGRSAGGLNHFSLGGAHLGGLEVSGNMSDLVVLRTCVLFSREMADFSGDLEIVIASLPRLEIVATVPTRISTYDGYPGIAARDDGDGLVVWVGNGTRVEKLTHDGSAWIPEAVDLDAIPAAELTEASEAFDARRSAEPPPAKGREVMHPKFGRGRVLSQEGEGEKAKLEIAFLDRTRTLQAKFVVDD